jgi:hypothetical protein
MMQINFEIASRNKKSCVFRIVLLEPNVFFGTIHGTYRNPCRKMLEEPYEFDFDGDEDEEDFDEEENLEVDAEEDFEEEE